MADPNWPADEGRTITLKADNTFEPYDGQFQQGGSSFKFPYIYFCAKDADIDWQLLEMGWREFTAGRAVMPEYQLHLDGARIENTCISRTNPVRLRIESNQTAGEDLGFQVYDSKGTFLATGYEAELNLDKGKAAIRQTGNHPETRRTKGHAEVFERFLNHGPRYNHKRC